MSVCCVCTTREIYLAVIFGWATAFSDSSARGSGAAAVHLLTLGWKLHRKQVPLLCE